jgi:two-component system, LytTR family, sensor kinase
MLLFMVLRTRPAAWKPSETEGRAHSMGGAWVPREPLPFATAALGLCWNAGALLMYGLVDFGVGAPPPLLSAAALTALGFLPSVVVHSVLRPAPQQRLGAGAIAIMAAAYLLSAFAGVLHFWSAATQGVLKSPEGLRLLTVGFILLVVALAFRMTRVSARRALSMVSLAVFAVSALHLADHDSFRDSLMLELVGHHASLPLALAILYQDYPFAFADLFLKRALSTLALTALALGGYVIVAGRMAMSADGGGEGYDPLLIGLPIIIGLAAGLLYPALRRGIDWFVDAAVLARSDYAALAADIARAVATYDTPDGVLDEACRQLAPALAARNVVCWRVDGGEAQPMGTWSPAPEPSIPADAVVEAVSTWEFVEGGPTLQPGEQGTNAVVVVPTGEAPRFALTIGQLTGGRRLLSDDLAMLEAVSQAMARRIDAIRINRERGEQRWRETEMRRLATEAELRALRAQVNPHFLFNALTTIGYLIQTSAPTALDTLMRLTELLRRVLRSEGEFTTLGSELDLVTLYLDLERARFEERLRVTVDVPDDLRRLAVPAFVIQPLVENAIKHGVARSRAGGEVHIAARVEDAPEGCDGGSLWLTVSNTGEAATMAGLATGRQRGVGLRNLEQRLGRHYGEAASLSLQAKSGATTVTIRIPVSAVPAAPALVETAGGV